LDWNKYGKARSNEIYSKDAGDTGAGLSNNGWGPEYGARNFFLEFSEETHASQKNDLQEGSSSAPLG
jgi:hypothetical protein